MLFKTGVTGCTDGIYLNSNRILKRNRAKTLPGMCLALSNRVIERKLLQLVREQKLSDKKYKNL